METMGTAPDSLRRGRCKGTPQELQADRDSGMTYRAIGQKYGVSHERIRQILRDAGTEPERSRGYAASVRKDAIAADVTRWLEVNGPQPISEIEKQFGLTTSMVAMLVRSHGVPAGLVLVEVSDAAGSGLTAAEMGDALRRAWARLQEEVPDATGLSVTAYDRVRRPGDPSTALVSGRSSWSQECAAAGVPAGVGRGSYSSTWTDEEILRWVGRYLSEVVGRPTFYGYTAWAKARGGDAPSGSSLRIRMRKAGLGTWFSIVSAAHRTLTNDQV